MHRRYASWVCIACFGGYASCDCIAWLSNKEVFAHTQLIKYIGHDNNEKNDNGSDTG